MVDHVKRKHTENCKVLPSRDHLMVDLPKNKVIAEIGVFKGEFARRIYNYSSPELMYLVDIWPENKGKNLVEKQFVQEVEQQRVKIIQQDSIEFLKSIPDYYFDWVYLDTSHTYDQTLAELNVLKNKVKKGGYIAGHDFCNCNPKTKSAYGVIPACHQFCLTNNWEYAYITIDVPGHFSYCLREIK